MENEDTEYQAKDHLSYLHTLYNALVQNNLFQVNQKIWSNIVHFRLWPSSLTQDRPVWIKTAHFKHSPFYPMRPPTLDLTLESYS